MDPESEAAAGSPVTPLAPAAPAEPEALAVQAAAAAVAPATPLAAVAAAAVAAVTPLAAAAPAAIAPAAKASAVKAKQESVALLVVDGVSGEIASARIRCPNCQQYVNRGLAVHYIALWDMEALDIQKELRDRVFKHVDNGCSCTTKGRKDMPKRDDIKIEFFMAPTSVDAEGKPHLEKVIDSKLSYQWICRQRAALKERAETWEAQQKAKKNRDKDKFVSTSFQDEKETRAKLKAAPSKECKVEPPLSDDEKDRAPKIQKDRASKKEKEDRDDDRRVDRRRDDKRVDRRDEDRDRDDRRRDDDRRDEDRGRKRRSDAEIDEFVGDLNKELRSRRRRSPEEVYDHKLHMAELELETNLRRRTPPSPRRDDPKKRARVQSPEEIKEASEREREEPPVASCSTLVSKPALNMQPMNLGGLNLDRMKGYTIQQTIVTSGSGEPESDYDRCSEITKLISKITEPHLLVTVLKSVQARMGELRTMKNK
jgi:hypothetical protein